jgi:hypothetical protein
MKTTNKKKENDGPDLAFFAFLSSKLCFTAMSVARAVFVVFVGVVATCLAALPCTAQQPIAVRYPPPANQLLYYSIFPTGHTYLTLLLYIVAKKRYPKTFLHS